MKTMTCKQLGGACDKEFHASTFEEIAELSKQHGREMFQNNDADHLKAMQKMQELMWSFRPSRRARAAGRARGCGDRGGKQ